MQKNDTTTREAPTFGVTLHICGRKSDEVTTEDRHAAALMCVFYIQSLFTVLSLISTDFAQRTNPTDLVTAIETFCQIGLAFSSEACAHIDALEDERKKLAAEGARGNE
jgi:hypothetical protein